MQPDRATPPTEGTNVMTRIELLERLKAVQQTTRFQGRDITTISAVLSNQALAKHIEVCEQAAASPALHNKTLQSAA
jgi:hypothetical protein